MRRTFTAMVAGTATIYYDLTLEWDKDEDPTESDFIHAYKERENGNPPKGFKAEQSGVDEYDDAKDLEIQDIEEGDPHG